MDRIKSFVRHHKSLMIYGLCSIVSMLLDAVIGYLLNTHLGVYVVVANTIGILISSIIHYLLISRFAFNAKYNVHTGAIYIGTFLLGIVLQNLLIYVFYEYITLSLTQFYRFMISKGISIIIPFFALFYLRKWLYEKAAERSN